MPGWRGRRESYSQVSCHLNSVHALAFMDKHGRFRLCRLNCENGQRTALGSCPARAADDRHGPRKFPPPQWWTVEEEGGGEAREAGGGRERDVLRPTVTLPPGMRPGPPSEVAGPQLVVATDGYVAAGAPLLAVSSLRGADGVDDTTGKFLLRAELKKKEEEEEAGTGR